MKFSTSITVDGYTAYGSVPRGTPAENKANSVFCPLGPSPTRAWFLLDQESAEAVSDQGGKHTVVWKTTGDLAATRTFAGLYLVKAERLEHGGKDDPSSLYLCEFADVRWVASQNTSTGGLIANIRSYANSADYLTGTSGYTWTSLVSELWTACAVLGAWPGLPYAPDGVPQNQFLLGVNAWEALCAILDQLDCAVAHNPLTNVYSIVQLGSAQAIAAMADSLQTDLQPLAPSGDVAATVRVWSYFHYKAYGQERDKELANNWTYNGAGGFIDVPTGIAGAVAGTVKSLWDDLPNILNENNVSINAADIVARATARKNRYVTRNSVAEAHRIHWGLQDIVPGGQVRAVIWRNWDDGRENYFGGVVTEFVSKSALVSDMRINGAKTEFISKALDGFSPPDLGRHSYPNYPRLSEIVQVTHASASAGDSVSPNASGFHLGVVRRWVSNSMAVMDPCWILFVDDYGNLAGQVQAIQGEFYGPGRLSGTSSFLGVELPVYLVSKTGSGGALPFQLTATLAKEGSATAKLCTLVGGVYDDTGPEITVVDPWRNPGVWSGVAGYQGLCQLRTDGDYDIVVMEQLANFANATLNGACCGEIIAQISNFSVIPHGHFCKTPDPLPTSALNHWGRHAGLDGDSVLLMRVAADDWRVIDVTKHLKTVITQQQISGTEIQIKTQQAYLEVCGEESDWTSIHDGTPCGP